MEKKYQVFVSSTYQDLQQERQEVMQALLELDCIPVGMELFPAADDDQWTLIKGLIRSCDYYILIVAGRYGSLSSTGKSYTQMEFEYAIEQNIPILSFIHKEPGKISADKTEPTDEGKTKLKYFIKLAEEKMCQFWISPSDLSSKVSRSLIRLIKTKPRIGWVRADEISSAEANREILQLKKENEKLQEQVRKLNSHAPVGSEKLQQGEDIFTIRFIRNYDAIWTNETNAPTFACPFSWNKIFITLAVPMLNPISERELRDELDKLLDLSTNDSIIESDIKTIEIQLLALGLIETGQIVNNGIYTYWTLTPYGRAEMVRLKALVKS